MDSFKNISFVNKKAIKAAWLPTVWKEKILVSNNGKTFVTNAWINRDLARIDINVSSTKS